MKPRIPASAPAEALPEEVAALWAAKGQVPRPPQPQAVRGEGVGPPLAGCASFQRLELPDVPAVTRVQELAAWMMMFAMVFSRAMLQCGVPAALSSLTFPL